MSKTVIFLRIWFGLLALVIVGVLLFGPRPTAEERAADEAAEAARKQDLQNRLDIMHCIELGDKGVGSLSLSDLKEMRSCEARGYHYDR